MSRFPVASGLEWAREADFLVRRIENPPGRPELSYRLGTWADFFAGMIRSLRVAQPPGSQQDGLRPPLARLNIDSSDDWVANLLAAWAVVGDVLTFYTERIANEGFLRTAREDLSVRELVGLLGYEPQSGVAAVTAVSFTVANVKGMPRRVQVPARARILSLPIDDRRAQTFETLEPLAAEADWNALLPRVPTTTIDQVLEGKATSLLLDGGSLSRLKAGDGLLLLARVPAPADDDGEPAAPAAPDATPAPAAATAPTGTVERQYFRIVRKVEAPRMPRTPQPSTRVSWQGELEPDDPAARLTDLRVFVMRKAAGLFGRSAPPWKTEPAPVKQQYEPPTGGLLLGKPPWRGWQTVGDPLPAQPVSALAAANDLLAAAIPTKGVYLSVDGGRSWRQTGQAVARKDVRSLLIDERGYLFAGTADGLVLRSVDRGVNWEALSGSVVARKGKRWERSDTRLPRTVVRSLASVLTVAGTRLVAGTDQGVFRSLGEASGWEASSDGLPGVSPDTGMADVQVYSLATAVGMPGVLFAGTSAGAFRSASAGGSWEAVNAGLPETDPRTGVTATAVLAVAAVTDARTRSTLLLAATAKGVLRSTNLGTSWQPANLGFPGTDPATGFSTTAVGSLASYDDTRSVATYLFAGTPAGLYISGDGAASWAPVAGQAADGAVLALAVDGGGTVLAATPVRDAGADEWPGFYLTDGEVDLDAVYPSVVAGSWLVLWQSRVREGPLQTVTPILDVATVERQDFTLSQVVTRLSVQAPGLDEYDLRTTTAFVQSEPLTLYAEQAVVPRPLAVDTVELASPLEVRFGARRRVFVTGQGLRAVFAATTELIPDLPGASRLTLAPGDEVQVNGFAAPEPAGHTALRVRVPGGISGMVRVAAADVVWRAALDDDPVSAELTEAEDVSVPPAAGQPESSWLIFHPPLTGCYDPRTVKVLANVGLTSQGATVAREVLGSGDATRANQRFTLSQPITYLPAATTTGTASTLEVRVNDLLYREVATLEEAAHYDQVYMVRPDGLGRPTVIFGDGVHGARLPHGRENVVATYRTGTWDVAVPAGQLMILQTRPLGLRAAVNPLRVPPGTLPESSAETRARAPLAVRTLARVVSAADYQDFCRSFPGIAKARVLPIWTGSVHLMQVTVAAVGGREMTADDPLLLALLGAVHASRATSAPLSIDSYLPIDLQVSLALLVDRAYRPAKVEAAVTEALLDAFSFDASSFCQTLAPAQLVAVAEGVPGVLSARVETFGPVVDPAPAASAAPEAAAAADAAAGDAGNAGNGGNAGDAASRDVTMRVQARAAHYDRRTGVLRPAELLRLAAAGIRLSSEVAS